MRNGRAGARELTIRLEEPDELFEERPGDVERGRAPEPPGIDRIRKQFVMRRHSAPARITIELPADRVTPEVERGVHQAFVRYCELGIARADYELASIHRDGISTLLSGAVVLAIGLILSEAVLRTRSFPKELRDFLGNGLFLVVAWVGLWYPLDTLFYSGRPHRAERRLLQALSRVEVVVRPWSAPAEVVEAATVAPPAIGQSSTAG